MSEGNENEKEMDIACEFCGRKTDGGVVCERCAKEIFDAELEQAEDGESDG